MWREVAYDSPMPQMIDIQLLGKFSVLVDGSPISPDAWRTRRAADVVKVLALAAGHRLHREQVMETLWPDSGPDAAATNLRKALHFARRALGEDAIVNRDGVLALWPDTALSINRKSVV